MNHYDRDELAITLFEESGDTLAAKVSEILGHRFAPRSDAVLAPV